MRRFLVCITVILSLAGCADSSTPDLDIASAQPYQTITPTETITPYPAGTVLHLPTPTVFIYTVVSGDTLEAIAKQHGITLDALMAANPGLQPTALGVGTQLIIPPGTNQESETAPTPVPLLIKQAKCWKELGGGMWCFALLQNPFAESLENLSAQLTLVDENGNESASQIAYAPLNILPAGEEMPVGVHFPGPVNFQPVLRVDILTAIRMFPGDTRYLPVMLENILISLDTGGRSAQVSGRVLLSSSEGSANVIWVLAVAYDKDGQLVGFRRWEAEKPLAAGQSLPFDFLVSSVGPEIDHVEFLTEARP